MDKRHLSSVTVDDIRSGCPDLVSALLGKLSIAEPSCIHKPLEASRVRIWKFTDSTGLELSIRAFQIKDVVASQHLTASAYAMAVTDLPRGKVDASLSLFQRSAGMPDVLKNLEAKEKLLKDPERTMFVYFYPAEIVNDYLIQFF